MPYAYLKDPEWRRVVLNDAFGKSFWGFFAFAVATGVLCYAIKGGAVTADALRGDIGLIVDLLPRVFLAISIAALIWVLLPRDKVSRYVGQGAGLRGLVVALVAGIVTPGGPSSAYALLALLSGAGAEIGALVSYITSWSLMGLQRIMIWDIPFMGAEFSLLRFSLSLPMPILAGLIARWLCGRFGWTSGIRPEAGE